MKKIILTILVMLTASSVFAQGMQVLNNKDARLKAGNNGYSWQILQQGEVIGLDNQTNNYVTILTSVNNNSDEVNALCAGKNYQIHAGSSLLCELAPGSNLQMKVDNFKLGARGTYNFISP